MLEADTRSVILERAIPLFAGAGYAGVSVRDVAALVGISGAALYHHFPDKQSLYLAAVGRAFERLDLELLPVLESDLPPAERLRFFVHRFTELLAADQHCRQLLLRELLDGDEGRMALLAEHVFRKPHDAMVALARELATDLDPYLLAHSMVGLVLFCLQATPLWRHLEGGRAIHDRPKTIARHVEILLTRACIPRSRD
jgi:AcrR family transcriptional regulator